MTQISRQHRSRLGRSSGFSLIELMVTIAVLVILLGIGVPGLRQFIVSNRLTSQINELVADISLARNEAGTRGINVTLCIAASSTACDTTATDWEAGRIIFVDADSSGSIDSGEAILKHVPALDGGTRLSSARFANAGRITFRPFGGLTSAVGGTFTLCSPGFDKGRQITVAASGRPIAKTIDVTTCP